MFYKRAGFYFFMLVAVRPYRFSDSMIPMTFENNFIYNLIMFEDEFSYTCIVFYVRYIYIENNTTICNSGYSYSPTLPAHTLQYTHSSLRLPLSKRADIRVCQIFHPQPSIKRDFLHNFIKVKRVILENTSISSPCFTQDSNHFSLLFPA